MTSKRAATTRVSARIKLHMVGKGENKFSFNAENPCAWTNFSHVRRRDVASTNAPSQELQQRLAEDCACNMAKRSWRYIWSRALNSPLSIEEFGSNDVKWKNSCRLGDGYYDIC